VGKLGGGEPVNKKDQLETTKKGKVFWHRAKGGEPGQKNRDQGDKKKGGSPEKKKKKGHSPGLSGEKEGVHNRHASKNSPA